MCPNCHHITKLSGTVGNTSSDASNGAKSESISFASSQTPSTPPTPPTPPRNSASTTTSGSNRAQNSNHRPMQGTTSTQTANRKPATTDGKPKKNHTALIVAIILAIIVCAGCFYFYNNAKSSKEEEAYEFAMKSDDPLVLQTYLDNYKDAPIEHIDSITAHLEMLKQNDNDWNNAVVSGSKQALLDYLSKHPDSEHKAEAEHKIDSLDWVFASNQNTADSYNTYLQEHANGEHVEEATDALKQIKTKTVQPEEKDLVRLALRQFFQAVNSKSESSLEASVAPVLTNFLGKPDATKADVVTFMDKIYKDDIVNMTWRLGNDLKVDKKEVGEDEYEYTASISASQDIDRTDPTKEKHANYKITAKVGPDGLISAMSMTKIVQ